jgi:hypothetical protein
VCCVLFWFCFIFPFFFGRVTGVTGQSVPEIKRRKRKKRKEKSQFDEPCGIELLAQLLEYIGPA